MPTLATVTVLVAASALALTAWSAPHEAAAAARPDGGYVNGRPHTGARYVYSQAADNAYKRLTRDITVPPDGGVLRFWAALDVEPGWDFVFVEVRTPGSDNWTTLPDANGHTSTTPGKSCKHGWTDQIHPQLAHYLTWEQDKTCTPTGTTGTWNAASGVSGGWQEWAVDLGAYAGRTVEVSIAYATDWSTQGTGVSIDDVTYPDGTVSSFEAGLDGWTAGPPPDGTTTPHGNTYVLTSASQCRPQSYTISGATTSATVTAISDSGLLVGASDGEAVVWRDPVLPVGTGIGGVVLPNGNRIRAAASDVNNSDVVAITRYAKQHSAVLNVHALLWTEDGGAVALPGSKGRPMSWVNAISDSGVAVGAVGARNGDPVPAAWRDGDLVQLPVPAHSTGWAADVNDDGLVVGSVMSGKVPRPWAWQLHGAGEPLEVARLVSPYVGSVDDHGRIVAEIEVYDSEAGESFPGTVFWSDRAAVPTLMFDDRVVTTIGGGLLLGYDDGWRGYGASAFIGRFAGDHPADMRSLPSPAGGSWDNTYAYELARGASPLAPQGGLTVVGSAKYDSSEAVVWTCVDKLLG